METVTVYLTTKDIVAKIRNIRTVSRLECSSEVKETEIEPFDIYLTDIRRQRVSVAVNLETFYRLSRICKLI